MTPWLRQIITDARAHFPGSPAEDYLWSRHIPAKVAIEAGVGYLPADYHVTATEAFLQWITLDRLVFPLSTADGQYIGIQTRSLHQSNLRYHTFVLPHTKGIDAPIFHAEHAGPILYDHARWQVVLVEGPVDALAVRAAGEPCVIASLTAVIPQQTRQWCRRWAGSVLALLDMDHPGRHGVDELTKIPDLLVSAPAYPAHDPAQLWTECPDHLRRLVARPTDDDLLTTLKGLL